MKNPTAPMNKGTLLSVVLVITLTWLGLFVYRQTAPEAGGSTVRDTAPRQTRPAAGERRTASAPQGAVGRTDSAPESESYLQSLIRQGMVGLRGSALVHFQGIPLADLAAILREIEAMPPSPRKQILLADLHEAWAERDPASALESALNHGADSVRGTLAGWAKASPAEAWNWVSRPETKATSTINEFDSYYRTILTTLGRQNQEKIAVELLDTMPPSSMRMSMVGEIAQTWAVKAPGDLALWLQQNEAKDRDAAAFAANFLGIILSSKGPDAILHAINTQGEMVGNAIMGAAVSQWAKAGQTDHLDVLVRALPGLSSERADIVLAQVGAATAPTDPASGLSLLLQVQDVSARNRWLWNTANALITSAPASAMDYVLAISDATTREARTKRIYSQWAAKDPTAARAKLDAADFPPALREVLTGGK